MKQKIPNIAYKALFVVLILFLLPFSGIAQAAGPKAVKGVLDLTEHDFSNSLRLDGEWEFFANSFVSPMSDVVAEDINYMRVPQAWNNHKYGDTVLPGEMFATYRLTVIVDQATDLALKIPRIFTAYKLFVNGDVIAEAGTIGTYRDASSPQYLPQVAFFDAVAGENEIIVHVSNFYTRSGGILESIVLGSETKILSQRTKAVATNILIFACLAFMGIYHLFIYFFRREDLASLFFGLFCFLISVRTLLVGERYLIFLFPDFNWEIAYKLATLMFTMGVPVIIYFFKTLYPKYFHPIALRLILGFSVAYGVLTIFTPARIYLAVVFIYQLWTVAVMIYTYIALIRAVWNREKGSLLIFIGSLFLVTILNDLAFSSTVMNDNASSILRAVVTKDNLSSVGQLAFTFIYSLLLAKKFSDSLSKEKEMTQELLELNANLDNIIYDRTKELLKSNEVISEQKLELELANEKLSQLSLTDALTNLWNRRKYNEILDLEWRRCLRFSRPLSLMIIDIDYFKEYNDRYGHLSGDDILVLIAQTLQTAFSRSTDFAARYGGEEFVVLLSETEVDEALDIANRLHARFGGLHIPHAASPIGEYLSVSIGVATIIPTADTSAELLFNLADKAMYHAKSKGKNQVAFASE